VLTLLDVILAPGGLSVVFQPIFEITAARPRLYALECLIRGPRGTNAERTDVLFDYIRRKQAECAADRACVTAALAEASRLPGEPRLSLNVHAATIGRDPGFRTLLLDQTREAGIDPHRLVVEIVEATPPHLDGPSFRRALAELREAGITIALDDVGLGQSNFRMILECRPDYFKVDRYFASGVNADFHRQAVFEAVAHLARRFGGRVVAEGVEQIPDLETLESLGIDLVQGHLFSPALAAPALALETVMSGPRPAPAREASC